MAPDEDDESLLITCAQALEQVRVVVHGRQFTAYSG